MSVDQTSEYGKLDATAKSQVDEILAGSGCDSILL